MREARPLRLRSASGLLVGIAILYALILIVAPLIAIVQGAFAKGLITLFNVLLTPDALHAFALTLLLAAGAVLFNGVAGLLLAWVLVRHTFPGKWLVNMLVDAPFVISPVIIGYALIILFGRQGWITLPNIQIVFAVPGMLIVTIIVSMPFVTREVIPALAALGPEQEEGAYTLGAGRWYTFRRIVLPEIRWALLYGLAQTFSRALGEFGAVIVVGGAIEGLSESATVYIYHTLNDRNTVGAYGASIVLAVIAVGLLTTMERLNRRRVSIPRNSDVDFA